MLRKLAEVRIASEFYLKVPEAIDILPEYTREVLDNEYALTNLIFTMHISRGCNKYRQFNDQMAALKQLRRRA